MILASNTNTITTGSYQMWEGESLIGIANLQLRDWMKKAYDSWRQDNATVVVWCRREPILGGGTSTQSTVRCVLLRGASNLVTARIAQPSHPPW
jgi:hypothetical protein